MNVETDTFLFSLSLSLSPLSSPLSSLLALSPFSPLHRTEQDLNGQWTVDKEQTSAIKADHVISAFGSQLTNPDMIAAMEGVELDKWCVVVVVFFCCSV